MTLFVMVSVFKYPKNIDIKMVSKIVNYLLNIELFDKAFG